MPFEQRDIEELSLLADQVSVTIENALLHESIAVQKAMAENLLQAIPVGIVAAAPDGSVRWFNSSAEKLLDVLAEDHIGQPVERLSSHLASLLHQSMEGESVEPTEWTEPLTRRPLLVQLRRLLQGGRCVGAMAILSDLTEERILREKQNNLERAAFWAELAMAISHEVRNPLVAISTFSQLLPERYADEEFREQFRDLTTQEVARLNGMIDQLDEYANPPTLRFGHIATTQLLEGAVCKALQADDASHCPVDIRSADNLPILRGDLDVLTDSIARLLHNACAAVEETARPQIQLRAFAGEIGLDRPAIRIEVSDNGCGIPQEIQEKVFSPFCTTKPRGVGLGLPIVRRTMIDHGGLISIVSGERGTVVTLTLPAADESNRG